MKMHWIPEGTRDFVPAQYHIKQNVKDRIEKVFDAFGYCLLYTSQQEVGITFIFVTHDQEEALTMSEDVYKRQ